MRTPPEAQLPPRLSPSDPRVLAPGSKLRNRFVPMKIAFDLRRIRNPGIGRYMSCLVQEILRQDSGHDYVLLLPPNADDVVIEQFREVTRVVPRSRYYSLSEQIELPRILKQLDVDLIHSPHFLLPLLYRGPSVVTIHDVIYLACPEDLESRIGRLYYSAMMRASARRACRIITDSDFSKQEIIRYLRVDPGKISVIYPAVDSSFAPASETDVQAALAKYRITRDFIFYTGIYRPRKNHATLIKAFKCFLQNGGDAQLVIAGPLEAGANELAELARKLDIPDRVRFTGFIDDSDLCALYTGARAYACPSLYEGFGFTILEAMACGTPVVCSRAASLPEVGGNAALYADANDPRAFAEALYQACTDEDIRRQLAQSAPANLRRFSWDKAANSCLELYAGALGRPTTHAVAFT
jgi:glycosyltransferase involved in cell wall biosynthesis